MTRWFLKQTACRSEMSYQSKDHTALEKKMKIYLCMSVLTMCFASGSYLLGVSMQPPANSENDGLVARVTSLEKQLEDITFRVAPTGTVMAFAGPKSKVPQGWVVCDGSLVNAVQDKSKFKRLFDVIGKGHGGSDKDTEFRLPDYRGRFLRGLDFSRKDEVKRTPNDPDVSSRTALAAGGNKGSKVGTLQKDSVGPHKHTLEFSDGTSAIKQDGKYIDTSGAINKPVIKRKMAISSPKSFETCLLYTSPSPRD